MAAGSTKMTSQMQAVMRLMTGKERTIAEKIADCNRPTWKQYKEDNQDKFEFAGVDQRKM
jgi:sulfur transfer protein SufE